jgi:hypothetical protein
VISGPLFVATREATNFSEAWNRRDWAGLKQLSRTELEAIWNSCRFLPLDQIRNYSDFRNVPTPDLIAGFLGA